VTPLPLLESNAPVTVVEWCDATEDAPDHAATEEIEWTEVDGLDLIPRTFQVCDDPTHLHIALSFIRTHGYLDDDPDTRPRSNP
jgi:hypothetical protein